MIRFRHHFGRPIGGTPGATNTNSAISTMVPVCLACDWLAREFKKALLDGNIEKATTLYNTGNVNLRNPYCLDKHRGSEVLFPIHMAILGGNRDLVRWLASDHHCPLRSMSRKRVRLLATSKGRSPIELALEHLDILQYLVVEKNLSILEEENQLDYKKVAVHMMDLLRKTPTESLKPPAQYQHPQEEASENGALVVSSCQSSTYSNYELCRSERRCSF